MMGIDKIISGGQTGVDRGALEFALSHGIPCDGYCPKGRRCEGGRIPNRYPMTELESQEYIDRTRKNVEVSDGTLILMREDRMGQSTRDTIACCEKKGKPCLVLDVSEDPDRTRLDMLDWLDLYQVAVLNIAGDREGHEEGIQQEVFDFLEHLFEVKKLTQGS